MHQHKSSESSWSFPSTLKYPLKCSKISLFGSLVVVWNSNVENKGSDHLSTIFYFLLLIQFLLFFHIGIRTRDFNVLLISFADFKNKNMYKAASYAIKLICAWLVLSILIGWKDFISKSCCFEKALLQIYAYRIAPCLKWGLNLSDVMSLTSNAFLNDRWLRIETRKEIMSFNGSLIVDYVNE